MKRGAIVDVETTGDHPEAEVIEFAVLEVRQGEGGKFTPRTILAYSELFRPELAIRPGARAVHHIRREQLAGKPTFLEGGKAAMMKARTGPWEGGERPFDFMVAHNAEFEERFCAFLEPGAPWLCTYKCALRAWPDAPEHKNFALLYWLEDSGRVPWLTLFDRGILERAHRAPGDTMATACLLLALLEEHSLEELLAWSAQPRLVTKVPFGEHRGKAWSEVDDGLLDWVLRKDFDEGVKIAARTELERRMAARNARDASPGPLFGGANA